MKQESKKTPNLNHRGGVFFSPKGGVMMAKDDLVYVIKKQHEEWSNNDICSAECTWLCSAIAKYKESE